MSILKKDSVNDHRTGSIARTVIYPFLADDGTQFHDGGNRRRTEGNCCGNAGSV